MRLGFVIHFSTKNVCTQTSPKQTSVSECLLATLALIIVHSLYIQKIVQASPAPLVRDMFDCSRGVVYIR